MLISREFRVKYTVCIGAYNPFLEILKEEYDKRGYYPEAIKDSAIMYEFKSADKLKAFEEIRENSENNIIQAFFVKESATGLIFETGYSKAITY